MSAPSQPKIVLICCSVFQAEVESLQKAYWPQLTMRFENSMLHMDPQKLGPQLESVVDKEMDQGSHIVLVYGDCSPHLSILETRPGVVRTQGRNCCEMLLGRDEHNKLSREGVFFLLPEWTRRWKEVFTVGLGLSRDNATGLMRDMHTRLIYLDTGIEPIPETELQECSEYCGLPFEVRPVRLDVLRVAIEEAMGRAISGGGRK